MAAKRATPKVYRIDIGAAAVSAKAFGQREKSNRFPVYTTTLFNVTKKDSYGERI